MRTLQELHTPLFDGQLQSLFGGKLFILTLFRLIQNVE